MKRKKNSDPYFGYEIEYLKGEELLNRIFFETELLILKATTGEATILINSEEHLFKVGTNFLLFDRMMLKFTACSNDFEICIIRFSANFLNEIYPRLDNQIFDLILFSAPDLYDEKEAKMTDLFLEQLCILLSRKEHSFKEKLAVNITVNYIYEICELTHKYTENITSINTDRKGYLIDKFYDLCFNNHSKHRNIEFYAQKLNITSRYLYKVCQDNIRMTPKECIDYITIGGAKKMLLTTNMTLQQIAIQFNFPDQATFGQYFKRNVGMPPSEFRNRYK